MSEQAGIPITIVRGGTSKAVFVRAEALRGLERDGRDALVRAMFGSPDRRQIDGLGGADLLTSKFAIIGPPSRPDADLDYTFAQVGIEVPVVAWDLNCGNISAAVGPYAIDEGIVPAAEPATSVRIHNTNTGKLIVADVPVHDGRAAIAGDFAIDGVPGTGARITLDFSDGAGAGTGALLPTGRPLDTLDVPGLGPVDVSIVDAANPIVFVRASDLGLTGTEDPAAVEEDAELMARLERIRAAGAAAAGMTTSVDRAAEDCPTTPFIAFVSGPQDWSDFQTGERRHAASADLAARLYVMGRIHKAYAGTGTICTGAAARIPGTIPNQMAGATPSEAGVVRIGHPSGVIPVEVEVEVAGHDRPVLRRAAIARTARRLLDGTVYVPAALAQPARELTVA
jgi:2-methylaconitate cis-trans-isomerase PrpF